MLDAHAKSSLWFYSYLRRYPTRAITPIHNDSNPPPKGSPNHYTNRNGSRIIFHPVNKGNNKMRFYRQHRVGVRSDPVFEFDLGEYEYYVMPGPVGGGRGLLDLGDGVRIGVDHEASMGSGDGSASLALLIDVDRMITTHEQVVTILEAAFGL